MIYKEGLIMKRLTTVFLIISLLISLVFSVPVYAQDSEDDLSTCSGSLLKNFMEEFEKSTCGTIYVEFIDSMYLRELSVKNMTLKYKGDKLLCLYESKGIPINILYHGDKMTCYSPLLPFFFFQPKASPSIADSEFLILLLKLMVFNCLFFSEHTCCTEVIDGISYHIEKRVHEFEGEITEYKYYFLEDELVRISKTNLSDPSSRSEDYNINVVYEDIDDSVFELPKTLFLDLTWFYYLDNFLDNINL